MNTPAEQRCTIVYDGTCGFCQKQMESIRRRDRHAVFDFLPNKDPSVLERFPQLAGDELNTGLRLVLPDQRVRVGADAVYEVARRLPSTRWFAWLYRVPGLHGLARLVYGYIAANRNSLPGRCGPDDTTCRVDDA